MMKMAAGSENESDDASENVQVTRTPALQINDDFFSQPRLLLLLLPAAVNPKDQIIADESGQNEAAHAGFWEQF